MRQGQETDRCLVVKGDRISDGRRNITGLVPDVQIKGLATLLEIVQCKAGRVGTCGETQPSGISCRCGGVIADEEASNSLDVIRGIIPGES